MTLCFYFDDKVLGENKVIVSGYMDSESRVEYDEFLENWNDGYVMTKSGNRCFGCSKGSTYLETFSAPTQSFLQKWLRDKHKIHITITSSSQESWQCHMVINLKNNMYRFLILFLLCLPLTGLTQFRINLDVTNSFESSYKYQNFIYKYQNTKFNKPIFSINNYKFTRGKLIGVTTLAFAGVFDGLIKGYEMDGRRAFQRKYNFGKYSWFGEYSWKRVYVNNDPLQGFKSPFHKWFGAFDFYHVVDDLSKVTYMGGSFTLGFAGVLTNQSIKHAGVDFATSFIVSSLTKSIALAWIRN